MRLVKYSSQILTSADRHYKTLMVKGAVGGA